MEESPISSQVSELRTRIMRANRSRDTKPELRVRRALHRAGFRFRLHRRDLPGTPDIVLPRYRTAVFVHGCYWHGHSCRPKSPSKTNSNYWSTKIAANRARDRQNADSLRKRGWRVIEIFECELDVELSNVIRDLEFLRACSGSPAAQVAQLADTSERRGQKPDRPSADSEISGRRGSV